MDQGQSRHFANARRAPVMLARLASHRALRLPGRRRLIRAAVAVVLAERNQQTCVLLMHRAERAGDPWSGHMSFPGGRLHAEDAGGGAAACRETREETGLYLRESDRVGRLNDRLTRAHHRRLPMVVSPFVFALPAGEQDWRTNHEVERLVWIPLAYFADPANRELMDWRVGAFGLRVPCYYYEGHRVWGLTLLMLDELLRVLELTR